MEEDVSIQKLDTINPGGYWACWKDGVNFIQMMLMTAKQRLQYRWERGDYPRFELPPLLPDVETFDGIIAGKMFKASPDWIQTEIRDRIPHSMELTLITVLYGLSILVYKSRQQRRKNIDEVCTSS